MSQEIEIEYKVLITKSQFNQLSEGLPFPSQSFEQINYYFETKTFDLKAAQSALRIRKKNGKYTLTLKEPFKENILETHDPLTDDEYLSWINGTPIVKTNVSKQLNSLNIAVNDLIYFGSLRTERKTFTKNDVEYMLDKSMYNGVVDYELEIEAPTNEKGVKAFNDVLQKFNIRKQLPITKIERFFQTNQI